MPLLLGIDTGGTYTDAVIYDDAHGVVATAKALTTRHDIGVGLSEAARAVLKDSGTPPEDIVLVSISTTLATNALVEGQGGRVALILVGFSDVGYPRAKLLALRGDPCISISGGHDAHGEERNVLDLEALDEALKTLPEDVAAFAVASMFAVRNPAHEQALRERLSMKTGLPVTCSHELSSRLDGPRRALTCVLNARSTDDRPSAERRRRFVSRPWCQRPDNGRTWRWSPHTRASGLRASGGNHSLWSCGLSCRRWTSRRCIERHCFRYRWHHHRLCVG